MSLTKQHAILAKLETSYGVDAVPTGAANAILCGNITTKPFAGSTADRTRTYPTMGASPKVHTAKYVTEQFDIELAGSGAAGTVPGFGMLLRACGFHETINAETSVVYNPISSSFESVTIYSNEGGANHALLGARGTVSLYYTASQVPYLRFLMSGLYVTPTAVALPAVTLAAFQGGVEFNKANTSFSLYGYDAILESLQIDQGNTVGLRDRPNAAYISLSDRMGAGSISIEAPDLGTKNYFQLAEVNTTGDMNVVHGTVAGNIVTVDAPATQLLQPAYGDASGTRLITANLVVARNSDAGNDDLVITFT